MAFWDIFKKSGPNKDAMEGLPEIFLHKTKARREENGSGYEVVCPYCLYKFHVWELQFRSESNSDAEEGSGTQRAYPKQVDEKLEEFWAGMNVQLQSVPRPVILRADDIENVRAVQLWDSEEWLDMDNPENREKVRHKAISKVMDKFGGPSKIRVCPYCHNELPDVIGRYPNYIFSMIGNTSSGKTVYLQRLKSSLINNGMLPRRQMSLNMLGEINLKVDVETKKMFVNTVQMQERLSDATPVGYMPPTIMDIYRGDEHILVTLFDFPGEAIWEENRTAFFSTLMQRNSENTDGWLFVLDSTTLPVIRSCIEINNEESLLSVKDMDDPQQNAEPVHIVSEFTRAFGLGNQVKCPVAFTFSKSDVIRYFANKAEAGMLPGLTGSEIFLQPDLNTNRDKVDLDELYQCNQELERFLEDNRVLNSARNSCPKHAWFAVSATGVEVRDGIPQAVAPACRVVDPLEWLLWMVGAVPGVATKSKNWARHLGASTPNSKR